MTMFMLLLLHELHRLGGPGVSVSALHPLVDDGQYRGRNGQPLFNKKELSLMLEDSRAELITLQKETAALRRNNAALGADVHDQADMAEPLDPLADHGKTLFATMCGGTSYFNTYCGPLFASFERAYGAAVTKHELVAFVSNVDDNLLEVARQRFAPWGRFEQLTKQAGRSGHAMHNFTEKYYGEDAEVSDDTMHCTIDKKEGKSMCNVSSDSVDNRDLKVSMDSLWFPWRLAFYLKNRQNDGFCYATLMDADLIFVRPIGRYLPKCDLTRHTDVVDWDVAFTVYDKYFRVPWADDPADVGRTKQHGLTRFNCGIALFNLFNVTLIRRFLSKWAHVSGAVLQAPPRNKSEDMETFATREYHMWTVWQELLEDDYRGNDQTGLALLVSSYRLDRLQSMLGWGSCAVCDRTITAHLELFADEEPLPVRFRGLPARILNHPESMIDGRFPPDLLILHLKGLWWRQVITKGVVLWDGTRRPEWNRDGIVLQSFMQRSWESCLPPEWHVPQLAMQVTASFKKEE